VQLLLEKEGAGIQPVVGPDFDDEAVAF